ncbi:uncharacterized protein GGQ97_000759 [Sphingomonas kaistensis]|uniref:DUF418 domain-containing protein n=1 Tax=Sphingomonas kaistensis TaxID=298708 RepID=A0A7X5Y4J7_9SPHN|nr:DUF418 domain-containing protein [Sphingomonas kaistensis]NJC04966.1 uncharacterized protein [Sphingomonas kaistensis]
MQATPTAPIQASERHHILDALRGWALAGVLLANMVVFIGFGYASEPERAAGLGSGLNDLAELLIEWLVVGKFYSLFSLLFGIGFAVQLARLEERGEGAARYIRRLAMLFLIGLAHLLLLWMGDILALYALMGGVLLLFRRASDRALIRWAVALWLVPVGWSALIHFAGINLAGPIYGAAMQGFAAGGVDLKMSPATWFNGADYLDQLALHPTEMLLRIADLTYQMRPAKVLGMFLIGLWIGRRGLFAASPAMRPLLVRSARIGIGIGLPLAFVRAVLHMTAGENGALRFAEEALYCVSTPLLALGYAAAFTLLWNGGAPKVLGWPAAAGRMALTNYLSQSLIQTLLFTGAGLALGNVFGLAFVLPITAAIFGCQVAFSRWWLARFRFGPGEWLWRSATYGRAQPMRLARPGGIAAA